MFRPKKINLQSKGVGKVLGSLETRVLEYLWGNGVSTARAICDALCKKERISFNAVNTVLTRLVEKGVLARRKSGLCFLYTPKFKREEFSATVSQRMLISLLRDKELFSPQALFAAMEELRPEERKRVRALIKKARLV